MDNLNLILTALPGWLIAAILIAAGWLTAVVARVFVSRVLAWLRFNHLCHRAGVCDFLKHGEVTRTPAELAGRGIYWLILIAAFLEAARILDIGVVAEFRRRVILALPALLSGGLVLIVGLLLVAFLAGFVRTVMRNAGSVYANLWWRITRWIGAVLVVAVAVEQADIHGTILATALQIVIAAFAFGTALAFGLGCKEMARNAMEKFIADLRERHRDASKSDMEG